MQKKLCNLEHANNNARIIVYVAASLVPILFPLLLINLISDYPSLKSLCASSGDSAFYWLQIDSLVNYGGVHGYFGFNGSNAAHGGLYAWGLAPLLPYYLFGKLFGWKLYSMTIANMVMIAVAIFVFLWLTNSSVKTTLGIIVVYICSFYTVGYSMYSTSEGERYALGILMAGIVLAVYRLDIHFWSETISRKTTALYVIAILFVVFCAVTIFLPFVIVLPLVLAHIFKKSNIVKRVFLSFGIGIPIVAMAYCIISAFSAPYPYAKLEFHSVFQLFKALISNLVTNLESTNLFNVIQYDSKPMFWYFIVYMLVAAITIYNFVSIPKLCTFLPVYYIVGFLVGICMFYTGEPNIVSRQTNIGILMGLFSECVVYENVHEKREEKINLILAFVILGFLSINGAWKIYQYACAEGGGTYEISDTLSAERAKFDSATEISDQLDRHDNTIAYYGLLDRMCLSLPGGAGVNYMYNLQVDDRMKYAVIRTENFDYSELLANLEEAYDLVFQDEYFILMKKR